MSFHSPKGKKKVQRTSSVGLSTKTLPSLGKLSVSNRKNKTDSVYLVRAGKVALLSVSPDHPIACLPNSPSIIPEKLIQKFIECKEVPAFRQTLTYKLFKRQSSKGGANTSGSLLFHSQDSPAMSGICRVCDGMVHIVGQPKRKKGQSSSPSLRFSKQRDRSASHVSVQSGASSRKDSKENEDSVVLSFYLTQLFEVKAFPNSNKFSLVFYAQREELKRASSSGWERIPDFEELSLKAESPEQVKLWLFQILQHVRYMSHYIDALVNQYLVNEQNNRVDFDSDKGAKQVDATTDRLRVLVDLAAILYGVRSEEMMQSCLKLSQFLNSHQDVNEEAGFWKDIAEKIEENGGNVFMDQNALIEEVRTLLEGVETKL